MERFKAEGKAGKTARSSPHLDPAPAASPSTIVYSRSRPVFIHEEVLRRHRILTRHDSPFADSYKILRTQVLHRLREHGWNMLGVTSPREGTGKTLTAINLAIAMATEPNQTVLLVDADLRAPRVHETLELERRAGLTEYLLDGTPLEEMLLYPGLGRLIVLPGGRGTEQSAELLASPRMAVLSKELKYRYESRIVIFDLPPVLGRADVLAFSPQLEALLLVVEDTKTLEPDLQQTLQMLKGATAVIGTVLNKAGQGQLSLPQVKRAVAVNHGWAG
ncbi:MAG: AAA family ATPase [Nitrospira sp.]